MRQAKPADERFWRYVFFHPSGCWLWTGSLNNGYGYFNLGNNKMTQAHRGSWFLAHGVMPKLQLDHLCRVRRCVNPRHLEEVTARENLLRSPLTWAHILSTKTHCIRGHELSGPNLVINCNGERQCRACNRIRDQRYKAKKQLQKGGK
jgi:hypothetical protein